MEHDIVDGTGAHFDVVVPLGDRDGDRALQRVGDPRRDRLRSLIGVDMQMGGLMGALPAAAQHGDPGDRRALEHRPVRRIADAVDEDDVGGIQPDDHAAVDEERTGRGDADQPSPAGDHHRTRPVRHRLERGELELAKRLLTVALEYLRGAAAAHGADLIVEVDDGPAEPRGEERRDGGLPGTRQAHQGDAADRAHRRRRTARRCAADARRTSATVSPPNFSTAAEASTQASIASVTTAPAGTTQMSLRS